MQAVILAAGRGTRMGDLTSDMPKPMLKVLGKNLIEHKIEALPQEVDEVILIVGYLKEKIMEFFGDSYKGKKITYIDMPKLEGTAKALWLAKDLLKGRFISMMGDDIYSPKTVAECLKYDWAIATQVLKEASSGGVILFDENKNLKVIEETPRLEAGSFVNTGLFVLGPEIFNYGLIKIPGKEEWGLPQTIALAARDHTIKIVESDFWIQISSPTDLKKAEELLKK